jgi:hypothetical protein
MAREISSITRVGTHEPFDLQVSRNQIAYHQALYKFGFNGAVANTEETIWFQGGNIPWPTTAATVYVSSTSTADTAGGTGAQTVEVQGLDADYKEIFGIATTNGHNQSAVVDKTTGQAITFLRVFRAFVTLSGSNGGSDGVVYLGPNGLSGVAGVPTTVYANLGVSNQTQIGAYTVPYNKDLFLDDINFTAAVSQANVYITAKFNIRLFGTNTWRTAFINVLQSNQLISKFEFPLIVPAKADVELRAIASSLQAHEVAASFQGVLIEKLPEPPSPTLMEML